MDRCFDVYLGEIVGNKRCGDECSPLFKTHFIFYNDLHLAINSSSGIPTRRARQILQSNCQQVLATLKIYGYIKVEIVVAKWPVTYFLSIDIYLCIAHGAIKNQ